MDQQGMATGDGFSTSAKIYQAAFARLAPGLGLPADAMSRLRMAYQAVDRKGRPIPEVEAAVSRVVGDYVWLWPWFRETRDWLAGHGALPRLWAGDGILLETPWDGIPHNRRVMLLTATIGAAVAIGRDLAGWMDAKVSGIASRPMLRAEDERCPAMAMCLREHGARIARGDLSVVPPFFPGDGCWIEFRR
jgi:hypothetical protein